MLSLAARLDTAIRAAGVPITGVSVGDEADRSTWRVTPPSKQAEAQPIINGFVIPDAVALLDEEATVELSRKAVRAIAEALYECIPAPTMTKAQMRARAIQIYKAL